MLNCVVQGVELLTGDSRWSSALYSAFPSHVMIGSIVSYQWDFVRWGHLLHSLCSWRITNQEHSRAIVKYLVQNILTCTAGSMDGAKTHFINHTPLHHLICLSSKNIHIKPRSSPSKYVWFSFHLCKMDSLANGWGHLFPENLAVCIRH